MYSVHRPYDVKMFSMGNPFLKDQFTAAGQNLAAATMKQPLLGGIPVTSQHSILPTACSIAGITEPWYFKLFLLLQKQFMDVEFELDKSLIFILEIFFVGKMLRPLGLLLN